MNTKSRENRSFKGKKDTQFKGKAGKFAKKGKLTRKK
jgi:hypothetical protein